MNPTYNRWFVRLNWTTLVLIYLVVIAGSFVRITGSGMGCPDWPKCFGQWIPPTDEAVLPADYKDIYAAKREKKITKFTRFLSTIGFKETAQKILDDETLLYEQDFNARKTWTEYINRLFGVLAGFGVLFIFSWSAIRYRSNKIWFLSTLNLIILVIQAWFGSIVVASNLVPWTITLHMLLALVIIAIQLLIILKISPSQQKPLRFPTQIRILIIISFFITFYQMFLGTQVREYIDELTKMGFGRETWTEKLGMPFFIHRSFSWLVLILLTWIAWKNHVGDKLKIIYTMYIILAIELTSGVLLAYADMPGLVQTAHLLFASVLFGIMFVASLRSRKSLL
jgi:heme a synthase